ncbi:ABC transporter ATP-binding protein [Pseudoclavibacter sp. RFBJ3]|uniref:ABC transporter ATP-binding protein n=1 Tax=unclassified Pseudoclavibacter TaxID=2615177 RepID=UPI000CE7989D|nr:MULTISPECIES: ABC transporter ATP-binding protein [unclassified Pseudoclavibacter]PPF81730.1 ABC transporter ATP-binding protein [Pseudoclavibacter sp. RFBJ5]PPF91060.1 ABC transporter ATP-binding protein [Pseudoclavibacter sp. RFBJ3]PPG00336.1 ABC transporter ATP-binding protein [Pseudoclavibacter sp. RFBH5]PPG19351.1 ABC transporter ATP-binding protein [Pseudoclavibacter sp. RFBI4]
MSVEVERLSKTYGELVAVDELSLSVPGGSVFAFLGENGAGKSTTIGCITTTLTPTSGTITVNGFDVQTEAQRVKRTIGAVFQSSLLDPLLTVRENLEIRAGFYGLSKRETRTRTAELAGLVGIEPILDRRYGPLSGGQRRRADIARALMHRPTVLFLDEPTAGLDPQSRELIWSTIHDIRRDQGTTIFLTTHYMEETENADEVCVIDKGRIVAAGTPAQLRAQFSSSVLTLRLDDPAEALRLCAASGIDVRREGDDLRVTVSSSTEALDLLSRLRVRDFEFRHGTMDDVFLALLKGVAA